MGQGGKGSVENSHGSRGGDLPRFRSSREDAADSSLRVEFLAHHQAGADVVPPEFPAAAGNGEADMGGSARGDSPANQGADVGTDAGGNGNGGSAPARPDIIQIIITLDVKAGRIEASGPVNNRILCLGLLEAGADYLKAKCDEAVAHLAAKPDGPQLYSPHGVQLPPRR